MPRTDRETGSQRPAVTPMSRLSTENHEWLQQFIAKNKRAPRVLHVGNIANNAYNNAKLLNEAGLDCDVICYEYYHLMGCPEWEDADVVGVTEDQFRPDWCTVNLGTFERPTWFAQGPLGVCIDYLVAKRKGALGKSRVAWRILKVANKTATLEQVRYEALKERIIARVVSPLRRIWTKFIKLQTDPLVVEWLSAACAARINRDHAITAILYLAVTSLAVFITLILRILFLPLRVLARLVRNRQVSQANRDAFDDRVAALITEFAATYPDRPDQLSAQDLEMYRNVAPLWAALFECYDLVQCYATDPILPMICGHTPYIAFEHGTLRSHTLRDDQICRLTTLGYRRSDHTFITNGDCLEYAKRIKVERYSPMLHPFDEQKIRARPGRYRQLHDELSVDFLFLCTLRHDWEIKGTDRYIRALPQIAAQIGRRFKLIMTRWGSQLAESEQLAASLGVEDLIHWIDPLPKLALIQTQKSVDALFDQIALPHFGATAPEGIAAGVPVLMSYEPESTAWIVDEPAPILSCWNVEDIVRNVQVALDPSWLEEYRLRAARWIDQCHCAQIVVNSHVDVYRRILSAPA